MANVSEGRANFIQGLSTLWTRFFKDRDQLEALYEGSEILMGQAYLDLLSNVLNISLREAPVFRKEFFKLFTVNEQDIVFRPDDSKYLFEITDTGIKQFKFLYNRIFGPTTILEKDIDFDIENTDVDQIAFAKNPFDWDGSGNTVPGVAYNSDGTYRELAFWIPDAQVDRDDLYLTYGYLMNRYEPSSEAYRALLQGITRYFVLGPTDTHLTSALNVILGLPVVQEDGEILQRIDTSDSRYNIVVTDKARYQFDDEIPLREDVLDEDNWGTLTLNAFEYLSAVFQVKDAVEDPAWWFDTTVPVRIMPDENRARRNVSPMMYENTINNPPGLVKIGDPGFIVGADDDGYIPSGRPSYRHLFSYIVSERFLKHHIYAVIFDPVVLRSDIIPFPRLDLDIQRVVLAGKSAYTYLYLEPGVSVLDTIRPAESYEINAVMSVPEEHLVAVNNNLQIGLKSWKIGDYYTYTVGGVDVKNESTDPIGTRFQDGKTPLCVGGADISHRVCTLASGTDTFGANGLTVATPVFDSDDVGRWVQKGSGDEYYEIDTVVSSTEVTFTEAVDTPGADDWTLYEEEHGHLYMGYTDWGVQIRVY